MTSAWGVCEMRLRQRDVARVRADALHMGIKKLSSGCDACADSYFALAVRSGASTEDVDAARRSVAKLASPLTITRRDALKAVASSAGGLAATVFVGGLLPNLGQAVSAAGLSGRSVHWAIGQTQARTDPNAQAPTGPVALAGFDGGGRYVGRLEGLPYTIFRSVDGLHFFIPWSRLGTDGATLMIDGYSAANGAHELTITGNTLPSKQANGLFEHLDFAPSADGRYLAVVRHTFRQFGDQGSKQAPARGSSVVTATIEMVDLLSGRSLAGLELDTANTYRAGSDVVQPSQSGDRLYIFSRRIPNGTFVDSVTVVAFDGTLRVMSRHTDGQDGVHAPYTARGASVITADGKSLARYLAPSLEFIDLEGFQRTDSISFPLDTTSDQKFPPRPQIAFAPDRTFAYVCNPGDGSIRTVNLAAKKVTQQTVLPLPKGAASNPRQRIDTTNPNASVLAPDGATLYIVDNRGSQQGVWAVAAPNLQVHGRILGDHLATAVSVAPDGTSLSVLSRHEDRIFVLKPDGSLVNHLSVPNAYSFVDHRFS